MYNLIEKYYVEIVGVFGTLSGVLLGAFLNRVSRYGKIKFYIIDCSYTFLEREEFGGLVAAKTITSNTSSLNINFEIDIVNTSEYSKKILRDIKFLVHNKNFKQKSLIKDNSTIQMPSSVVYTDDLRHINLNPKEVKNLNLSVSLNKNFEEIIDSKWYFEYTKMNGKKRRIEMNKNNVLGLPI